MARLARLVIPGLPRVRNKTEKGISRISPIIGPGGIQGVYDYSETETVAYDYIGSGQASAQTQTAFENRFSSDNWSYSGWDDYTFAAADSGSFDDAGDTGYYSSTETGDGNNTYNASGTFTYWSSDGYYTSSGSGTSAHHETESWSWTENYAEAYVASLTTGSQRSFHETYDWLATHQSQGSSSYTSPIESSTSSYTGQSTTSRHDGGKGGQARLLGGKSAPVPLSPALSGLPHKADSALGADSNRQTPVLH